MSFKQHLLALQQACQLHQLDGFYIPQQDPHNNEYIPANWQRRAWACGFDGSAGDLLILPDQIILWTDSRYTLQAEQQLSGLPVTIIEHHSSIIEEVCQFLLQQNKAYTIGVDAQTITIQQANQLSKTLSLLNGELKSCNNLVDELWHDQPSLPTEPILIWDTIKSIPTATDKIKWLQHFLSKQAIDAMAITSLDTIAWLFNIRGQDILFNPVCISYVLVTPTQTSWFLSENKITHAIQNYTQQHQITVKPYHSFANTLSSFEGCLGLDYKTTSWWVALTANQADIVNIKNPIYLEKSKKTADEIDGMQQAHIADSIALVHFFHWLENNWQYGIDEFTAADKASEFRRQQHQNQGLSFSPISSFASNGAIVHYSPNQTDCKTIDDSNLFLFDSGGQYLTGTTDITRVIHLGTPTQQQIDDYTNVLKGHIDLAKAIFPKGTNGTSLDALARQYLWQASANFGHGTGHGVGCFLNVHEGPCGITPRNTEILQVGQIVSNEPGIYRANDYGIRIENLQAVIPHQTNQFGEFLMFHTLTLFPYARNLINNDMLNFEQRQWINEYHQRVFDTLAPLCNDELQQWLRTNTAALQNP